MGVLGCGGRARVGQTIQPLYKCIKNLVYWSYGKRPKGWPLKWAPNQSWPHMVLVPCSSSGVQLQVTVDINYSLMSPRFSLGWTTNKN